MRAEAARPPCTRRRTVDISRQSAASILLEASGRIAASRRADCHDYCSLPSCYLRFVSRIEQPKKSGLCQQPHGLRHAVPLCLYIGGMHTKRPRPLPVCRIRLSRLPARPRASRIRLVWREKVGFRAHAATKVCHSFLGVETLSLERSKLAWRVQMRPGTGQGPVPRPPGDP